jgi:magnesium transporter
MALGEIDIGDIARVLWKEIRIGIFCGLGLGAVNFLRVYLMNGRDAALALMVSLSLFVTVLMAKSVGCVLPMIAKKLRLDPAIMAAPLITTIIDAASLLVYFSIAKAMFGV